MLLSNGGEVDMMMSHALNARRRRIVMSVVVGVVLLVGMFTAAWKDPLVTYRGETLRNSALMAKAENPIYCKMLSSFSFGANYACFDSETELEAFIAER